MNLLLAKLKESVLSVLPITVLVLIIGLSAGVLGGEELWRFLLGGMFLIAGMSLFNAGADVAMVETGNRIGAELTRTKKLWLVILISLLIGILVTVAEPDLMVLAAQLAARINRTVLILAVGAGVGIFMAVAVLRIIFQMSLRVLLLSLYAVVFVLAIFVPPEFLPLSFDAGGVTTGPMTVPFIMALGAGVAASKKGGNMDDSFGIVALCSIGPVLAVMILGIASDISGIHTNTVAHSPESVGILMPFLAAMPMYIKEVSVALLPVIGFIIIFNFTSLKLKKKAFTKIGIGFVNVFAGLVVFLTGVNVGFAPVGKQIGEGIVGMGLGWILLPIATVMGFFTVLAEPAVHVLTEQIEEISGGAIRKKTIRLALMAGVGTALALSMVRVLTGISLWWIILPGYAAALLLTLFAPKVFTAIAFDSGGVASGPMTAAFILPFAAGASLAGGGNIYTDAFGVVALVAMTPLVTIQIVGVLSVQKRRKKAVPAPSDIAEEVIEFDEEAALKLDIDAKYDDIIDFDQEESTPVQRAARVVRTALSPHKKSIFTDSLQKQILSLRQETKGQEDTGRREDGAENTMKTAMAEAEKESEGIQPILQIPLQTAEKENKKEGI
jgi:hypothetical protein